MSFKDVEKGEDIDMVDVSQNDISSDECKSGHGKKMYITLADGRKIENLIPNGANFNIHKNIGNSSLESYSSTYVPESNNVLNETKIKMDELTANKNSFSKNKSLNERKPPTYSSVHNMKKKRREDKYKHMFDSLYYFFKTVCLFTSFVSIYIGILHIECDDNRKFRDYLIAMGVDVFVLTLYTILFYNAYGTLKSVYNIIIYCVCISASIPWPILTNTVDYSELCMNSSIYYIYLVIFITHMTVYITELFVVLYQFCFKNNPLI